MRTPDKLLGNIIFLRKRALPSTRRDVCRLNSLSMQKEVKQSHEKLLETEFHYRDLVDFIPCLDSLTR